MQIQDTVHSLVGELSRNLVESLKDLQSQQKIIHRQQQSRKIKAIFGMMEDQNMEELENELNEFEDPYLNNLAKTLFDKLRHDRSTSALSLQQITTTKQLSPQKKQGKPKKEHGNSLIKGVLGKFMKIEKDNARPMILPDKQPKCYYDSVKRKYVIEGEEQEEVKEIPKPPPATKMINAVNGVNGNKDKKKSQIDDLMAPPAYKRKGAKKKEENMKQKPSQISFQSLEQKIVLDLQNVEDQILRSMEGLASKGSQFSIEKYEQLASIGDQVRLAQEVSDTLLTRLFSSSIDSQFDGQGISKIQEKLVKLEQSNQKIIGLALNAKGTYETLLSSQKSIREQESKNLCQRLVQYQQQICLLNLENSKLNQELESRKRALEDERQKFRLNLESEVSQNTTIKNALQQKKQTIDNLEIKNTQLQGEIRCIQNENKLLHKRITDFQKSICEQQKAITGMILEKFNQLASMDLPSQTIQHEDENYLNNHSKQMTLNCQQKQQDLELSYKQSNPVSLLELSHCLNILVRHYENALKAMKRQNSILVEQSVLTKSQHDGTQQSLQNENKSLVRSMTRMKSLMQNCKQEKEEYEMKVTKLRVENEKIVKQLMHIREEHNSTKHTLQQHIRSTHTSTGCIQQQFQADREHLQHQLQLKEIECKAIQRQLEESDNLINELVKQSKSRIMRIEELSKELKGVGEDLDESCAEGIRLKSRIWELQNERQQMMCEMEEQKIKAQGNLSHITSKLEKVEQKLQNSKSELSKQKQQRGLLQLAILDNNSCQQKLKGQIDELNSIIALREQEIRCANQKEKEQDQIIRNLSQSMDMKQNYLLQVKEAQNKQAQERLAEMAQLAAQLRQCQILNGQQAKTIISQSLNAAAIKQEWKACELACVHKIEELTSLLRENQTQTQRLNEEVEQFKSMVHNLRVKMDEMEQKSKAGELQAQAQMLKVQNRQIVQQNERLHSQIQKLVEGLQQSQSKLSQSQSQISTHLGTIGSKQQQCQQLMSRVHQIQGKHEQLKQEMNALQVMSVQVVSLQKQLESSRQQLQRCQQEMEICRQQLTRDCLDRDQEIETCNMKIKEMQQQIQSMNQCHKQQASQQQLIISQLMALSHPQQLASANQQACQQQAQQRGQQGEQQGQQQNSLDQIDRSSQQIRNELTQQVSNLNFKISLLQQRLAHKENELIEANRQNETLNSQIENLLSQLQDNSQQILLLQSQISSLAIHQNSVQSEVSSSNKQQSVENNEKRGNQVSNDVNEQTWGMSKQQKELQLLVSTQDSSISEQNLLIEQLNLDIERMTDLLRQGNDKVAELQRQKSQVHQFYNQKLGLAEEAIQKLERQVLKLEHVDQHYQVALRKIQSLSTECAELKMDNQGLIKTKDQILTKLIQYQSLPREGSPQKEDSTLKVQQSHEEMRKAQIKDEPAFKPNSFFESLSSLFLTQSETNKLSLNGK